MKPICVPCQRFFRPKKNGYYFIEGMSVGPGRARAGIADSDQWKPYKMHVGDLWECHGCGANIVVGVAGSALAEHYQNDFDAKIERYGARQLQVNDC